jgi:hypothetical protein
MRLRTFAQHLRGPVRSRRVFQYELGLYPLYWRIRRRVRRAALEFRAIRFRRRIAARQLGRAANILAQLLWLVVWQVFSAIVCVAALAALSNYCGSWIATLLPIHEEAEINYLSTLGQVSAGLLALYFTAISVVVSTAYSRVPGDIRGLIMREEVGSFYFKVLAFFAAVVTITLAGLVFKLPIGALNLLLVTGLCLFAIYSFVILGMRAFAYFEPTSLLPHLTRDLQQTIALATPGHPHWSDESFQTHHQREAQRILNSYDNLVSLSSDAHSTNGLQEVATHLVTTMTFYAGQKHRIPTSSLWFARSYKHKDWLTSSYNEVGIALATGTSLQPESVPNHQWFEEQTARILTRIFGALANLGQRATCVRLASQLHNTLNIFGRCFLLDEAVLVIHATESVVREESEKVPSSALPADLTPLQERLALLDVYSSWPLNLVLGFAIAFERLSVDRLAEIVALTEVIRSSAIYQATPLPRSTIERLEFIHKAVGFERHVLGYPLSPRWFRTETLAHALTEFLRVSCDKLNSQFETIYRGETDAHLGAGRYIVAALIAQKGLEGCNKLLHTLFD